MPKKPDPKPKKPEKPKRMRHDWAAIEAYFVHGDVVENAKGQKVRTMPTASETARKFGVSVSSVSERANAKDSNGKNWHDRRNDFSNQVKTETNTKLTIEIANAEVAFRSTTLDAARLAVQHCSIQLLNGLRKDSAGNLRSTLQADTVTKLTGALRKAQETGLVAMDRPADGAKDGDGADESDWSLMRKVRAGLIPVPALDEGGQDA